MSRPTDRDYYRLRADAARRQAENAASPLIAAIHRELERLYEEKARGQRFGLVRIISCGVAAADAGSSRRTRRS